MVLYLGFDFLSKAVVARRKFLSRCLMTVPQHLDHVEFYPHKGKLQDVRYRSPWTRAKADEQFLIQEGSNICGEVCKLSNDVVEHRTKLEQFESVLTRKESNDEKISFDLNCDIVLSSNPSSPDLFTPDDFFDEEKNIFNECYNKENIESYSTNFDGLKLEEVLSSNGVQLEDGQNVPDFSELSLRLKPVMVKDPLILDNGKTPTESSIFRDADNSFKNDTNREPVMDQQSGNQLFIDRFEKVKTLSKTCEVELENVITMDTCLPDRDEITEEMNTLLKSVSVPRAIILMEEEKEIATVVAKELVTEEDPSSQRLLQHGWTSDGPIISFLDVNEIIVTDEDILCKKALLDSPLQSSPRDDGLALGPLQLPVRETLELSQQKPCLLDERQKQSEIQTCLSSEKYCNEIQSARLPEPQLTDLGELEKDDVIETLRRVLGVCADTDIGCMELELSWDIVDYSHMVVTDPTHMCEKLSLSKPDDQITLKEVEKLEKYCSADLYSWKEQVVNVLDENVSKTKNCEEPVFTAIPIVTSTVSNKQNTVKKFMAANFGSDPLGDFMALRSKSVEPENKIEDSNEKQSVVQQLESQMPKFKQSSETSRKTKHHVVHVKLSDDFQQVLNLLQQMSLTHIEMLKQSGDISSSSTFQTITPDISRFLLKQREKCLTDNGLDVTGDPVYKSIVFIHGLSGAADITSHCCLDSAIGYLSAVQEKYKTVLGSCLDEVRQQLFELNACFNERQIRHPKVVSLCKEIETWLKKKRAKSKDNEQKILILLKRDMPSLLSCLKSVLNEGKMLTAEIMTSSESECIIKSLDAHNCLIVQPRLIYDTFPWAQFCLVVEYEGVEGSPWQQHCERQSIRHMTLQLDVTEKKECSLSDGWAPQFIDKQICMMASQTLTNNTELLQLLETRQNILLLERDYSLLEGANRLFFSDLDVDESTCIVVEDITVMADDRCVQNMVTKMAALSVKYTSCWFILFSNSKAKSYQFTSHVVSNISRLQAAIANFVAKSLNFVAKVVLCSDTCEVASVIRSIGERCLTAVKNRPKEEWLDRGFLTDEITQEEKFLLMMPCLSSFSAQLMIKTFSMKHLFVASLKEMTSKIPWMSVKMLKTFYKFVNSSSGLNLREDRSDVDLTDQDTNFTEDYHQQEGEREQVTGKSKSAASSNVGYNNEHVEDMYIHEDFQENIEVKSKQPLLYNNHHNHDMNLNKESCNDIFVRGNSENHKCNGTATEDEMKHPNTSDVKDEITLPKGNVVSMELFPKSLWQKNVNMSIYDPNIKQQTISATATKSMTHKNGKHSKTNASSDLHALDKSWENLDHFIASASEPCKDVVNSTHCYEQYHPVSKNTVEGLFTNYGHKIIERNPNKDLQITGPCVSLHSNEKGNGNRDLVEHWDENKSQYLRNGSGNYNPNCHTEHFRENNLPNDRETNDQKCPTNKDCHPSRRELYDGYHSQQIESRTNFDSAHNTDSTKKKNVECVPRIVANNDHWFLQNQMGQPIQTFDYNHGLHFQEINSDQGQCHASGNEARNEYKLKDASDIDFKIYKNKLIHLIANEFPSAAEIDISESTPKKDYTNNVDIVQIEDSNPSVTKDYFFHKQQSWIADDVRNPLDIKNSQTESTILTHGSDCQNTISDIKLYKPFKNFALPYENSDEPEPRFNFDFNNQSVVHKESEIFNFDPKLAKHSEIIHDVKDKKTNFTKKKDETIINSDIVCRPSIETDNRMVETEMSDSALASKAKHKSKLILNPNMERLSLRPDCIGNPTPNKEKEFTHSLADDLRETTRRFLANSQQFSRFGSHTSRHPLQKMNIGLAQPLLREKNKASKTCSEDRMMMVQSPWATDDSPPMDLEYDNSQINGVLYTENKQDIINNRVVFTNQTPQKKRKLTYQRIPGKKGQTKLIFK